MSRGTSMHRMIQIFWIFATKTYGFSSEDIVCGVLVAELN
jgi:hypothetical protein